MSNPTVTIPPFADRALLPACAVNCGVLYDVNGGCVPPGAAQNTAPAAQTSCFCANAQIAPLATAVTGVCDAECTNTADLTSIANWYRGLCKVGDSAPNAGGNAGGNGKSSVTTTTTKGGVPGTGDKATGDSTNGGNGDWLSNHYQWVIMIVILVVGIAGIWIGACIWRRRYLRKRDRQQSLGQKHSGSASRPSWGPTVTGSESGMAMTQTGQPNYAAAPPPTAKKSKQKKKWTVGERT